jgi:uncharacterized membrane protein YoaK (UPF0700 family)
VPATPLPDPRASQPSLVPSPRQSAIPSSAIGSVMPGASVYLHSALLSAVAGYVDAAGFTLLVGLFPAHLTGEIVGDAIAFSSGQPGEHVIRFWILPVFVASVMTATLVARTLQRRGRRALTGLLALVSLALALFSASDGLAHLLHASVHIHLLLGGACAVAAMGFQNALMRESLRGSCPTTVMTGNLTHVVIDIVDHLLGKLTRPHARDRRPTSRLLPTASALLAFIACAVLGGFLTRVFGSLSVALPAALTATLTFRSWIEDHKPRLPSSPLKNFKPARLPGFETWPEALSSLASVESGAGDTTSTVELAKEPGLGESEARTAPHKTERQPMKRTISGTQLSTRSRRRD